MDDSKKSKGKALVTGATGFVGKHLVSKLNNEGFEVTALCRKKTNAFGNDVQLALGDVTDSNSLRAAVSGKDVIFHLAGVVGYSKAQRPLMEAVNVGGTANLLDALDHQTQKLIHMSSVVAVGASFSPDPLDETANFNLSHLNLGYFETKKAAEDLVMKAVKDQGLHALCVNPSTIYGAGDMEKGSRNVQLKVAKGKFPFYPPGGVNIVDIDCVVEAMVNSVELGRAGERYILSGENLLLKEVFEIIAETAGVEPPKIPLPKFLIRGLGFVGDGLEIIGKKGPVNTENAWASVLYHWFDNSKAIRELGLRQTNARKSIEASILWAKEHGKI